MKLIKNIPLFAFLLLFYNIVAFGGSRSGFELSSTVSSFNMVSGATFSMDVGELLIMVGIAGLYIEIFKATRSSIASILDHFFSMLVFVAFLVEFLLVTQAATAAFLILTLMSFLDVVAGFTVSISTARRDVAVG